MFPNDQVSIHLCLCLFGVRQQNLNVCVYPYMPLEALEFVFLLSFGCGQTMRNSF